MECQGDSFEGPHKHPQHPSSSAQLGPGDLGVCVGGRLLRQVPALGTGDLLPPHTLPINVEFIT